MTGDSGVWKRTGRGDAGFGCHNSLILRCFAYLSFRCIPSPGRPRMLTSLRHYQLITLTLYCPRNPPSCFAWNGYRACGDVERSLIPDRLRGLSVWCQDIRWSHLGYALERKGTGSASAAGPTPYLDWMEIELQVEDPCEYNCCFTLRLVSL